MTGVEVVRGRVLRSVGGVYDVEVAGASLECSLRGRLKREKGLGRVAVGDEVEAEMLADGSRVIAGVLPRSSRLSRRTKDGRREQVIAANVDQLAAVFSLARPEPLFPLLDRFLVLAESSELPAFLVVNKVDLTSEDDVHQQFDVYEQIGYPVVYTSAKRCDGLEELRDRLAGCITLFVGPSGAGKSSLLNALQPGLGLRVGELSKALQRGRHTTVAASLHPLDVGGYVVDTPGLGDLRFWEVGTHELGWCFREFRPHLGSCKFQDCSHEHEPGCAVIEAKESGAVSESRYASYLRVLEVSREQGS
jgi:ribosome biogenesis GTPase